MPKKSGINQFVVPLEELLEAGCHFGHQARRWNPKMAQYIWAKRDGVHIIDLVKTQKLLSQACEAVRLLASAKKTIVFVGTKRQASSIIAQEAEKVGGVPFVSKRWLGGTITNWKQLSKTIGRLKDLESKKESGELNRYTKKERVLVDREVARLDRVVGGLRNLTAVPDALFVVDIKREEAVVREAKRLNIPVIAIVDTNCDPEPVMHVIPANDDAVRSIGLITAMIAQAVRVGREQAKSEDEKQASKSNEQKQ